MKLIGITNISTFIVPISTQKELTLSSFWENRKKLLLLFCYLDLIKGGQNVSGRSRHTPPLIRILQSRVLLYDFKIRNSR